MAISGRKLAALMLATGLLCCVACFFLAKTHSSAFVFLFILASIAFLFCEYMSAKLFLQEKTRTVFGLTGIRGFAALVGLSVAIGLVVEFGTLVGAPIATPTDLSDWNVKRIILFSYVAFGGFLFRYWYWGNARPKNIFPELRQFASTITKADIIWAVALILVFSLGCYFVGSSKGFSAKAVLGLGVAAGLSVAALVLLRRHSGKHPEYAFLVIALSFGTYLILAIPPITVIAWDDQIHYKNAVNLSYVFDTEVSNGEETIRDPNRELSDAAGYPTTLDSSGGAGIAWDEDDIERYSDELDADIDALGYRPAQSEYAPLSYQSFGYIPSAIAFWIARLIQLPFTAAFAFAKWFNLLFYVLICFAAIRILPVKKTLFAVLALLPTELFLASHFAYDPWVTCVVGLAIALIIREIYRRDEPMTTQRFAAISIAFIMGLGPKAIYFPLIGLLFMVPRCKFANPKQHRLFIASTVVLALVVLGSFVVPFLVTSGGAGDLRGGSDVNPSGQIRYILNNPVDAVALFGNFLFGEYLTIPASDNYTMFFAYLGNAKFWIPLLSGIPLICILLVSFGDNFGRKIIGGIGGKIWSLIIFFVTVLLIALALYVDYTPVGLNTINGVQERYLVPLLFPTLAICTSLPFKNRMGESLLAGIALSGSTLLLCITVFANVTRHLFA